MTLASKLTTRLNPNESTIIERSVFFLIIGVAFYLLNRFNIRFIDDFFYSYIYGTYEQIDSLKDILNSQYEHYFHHNGRFIVHCIIQLFCGILGDSIFAICNTLFFLSFIALTIRLIYGTFRTSVSNYVLITLVLWISLPVPRQTVLGNMAQDINYLWVASVTAIFIIILNQIFNYKREVYISNKYGLFVIGFLCGALQESFTIPIAGALVLYSALLYYKHSTIDRKYRYLIIGYMIGACFLVLAPSNFFRYGSLSLHSPSDATMAHRILVLLKLYVHYIVMIVLSIIAYYKNRTWYINHLKHNAIIYLSILVDIIFCVIVVCVGAHQLFYLGWAFAVLEIQMIKSIFGGFICRHKRAISFFTIITGFLMYIPIYKGLQHRYDSRDILYHNVMSATDGIVAYGEYYASMQSYSKLQQKYVLSPDDKMYIDYMSHYLTGDADKAMIFSPVLPIEIEEALMNAEYVSPNIWYMPQHYCYVVKTPIDNVDVKIQLEYKRGISRFLYALRGQATSFLVEKSLDGLDRVSHNGYRYYFMYVLKDNKKSLINIKLIDN